MGKKSFKWSVECFSLDDVSSALYFCFVLSQYSRTRSFIQSNSKGISLESVCFVSICFGNSEKKTKTFNAIQYKLQFWWYCHSLQSSFFRTRCLGTIFLEQEFKCVEIKCRKCQFYAQSTALSSSITSKTLHNAHQIHHNSHWTNEFFSFRNNSIRFSFDSNFETIETMKKFVKSLNRLGDRINWIIV